MKQSGRVTASVRNKKFEEDHLLQDLVTTLTLEMCTCTAQVASPRQAFITVLLRNHVIGLPETNLLGSWQQLYSLICFLLSHSASQIRSRSSKDDSGPITQLHSTYFCCSSPQIFSRGCILFFVTPVSPQWCCHQHSAPTTIISVHNPAKSTELLLLHERSLHRLNSTQQCIYSLAGLEKFLGHCSSGCFSYTI